MSLKSFKNRIIIVLFAVFICCSINTNKSYGYTNHTLLEAVNWLQSKVGTPVEYDHRDPYGDGAYNYQCTDLIYAYYDYLAGSEQVKYGDAISYVWNNDKLVPGWTFTKTPTQGDIVVWGANKNLGSGHYTHEYFGHVGIVWTVNADGTIDTIENNGDPNNLQGPCKAYTRNSEDVDCYIHPDFYDQTPSKPDIPSSMLNLGNNFYAYMLMSNHLELFNVDIDSQVILQQGVHLDKKQIWNFVRQSDGSYVIKNVATGKYLDVLNSNDYDGGVIRTFSYNGSNAQKFFLYGTQDNCVIRPACSAIRTVSIDGGINSVGKKLNMWEYWGVETQLFNIWKVQEAKSAKLNYNANGSNVTLNWIKDKDTDQYDRYNMIIKSGTVGNVKEYKKIADVAGTSYCINLPAGYYEITLESWNYFSHAYSNVIKFTIKNTSGETQHTHNWNSGKVTKSSTCTSTGVKTYTCTVCGKTKTETIAKTAHNYKTTTKRATLYKKGSIVKKCSCGHIKLNTPIAYPKTIKLKTTSYTYNGKVRKPGVIVTDSNGKTIASSNYTITYSNKNSKKVGEYTVTIKFKGNYEGKKKLTYKINPKGVSLKKLTKGKKQFKVTWGKNTTQTTGYEVQYSTNKNFKSGTKKVKIKKNKTTSTIIKKLKGKKKYYVRVRTYKNVDGNKICSGWSKVLNVKTK